jgi:DNA-binding transcriptional ArsR family regulator
MERLSARGKSRVTSLAKPFHISKPAISRHLRVLEDARLIKRRRPGRLHLIWAGAAGWPEAQRWIAHYAAGWDSAFDALDKLLKTARGKGKKP